VVRVNRGVVEYRDERLTAIAVVYYFPHAHDPRWLAISFSIQGRGAEAMTFTRDDVQIVRPDGVRVPLVSQRDWRRERASLLPLLLQKRGGAARSPFWSCGRSNSLRFFVDSGTRWTLADVTQHRCVGGDLFFAASEGEWAGGIYELAIGGEVGVRLPIEIE